MSVFTVSENEYLEQASQIQCDPPRSLRRPTGNPTEFPMDAFPNVLKNSVLAIYDKTQAPIAICAPKAQPLSPMLTCSEPTFEGLCRYMVHGQPRIGIFSAEGGQFIGGHGMREENKLKTAAAFSELWDGTDIKCVRGGDGVIILPGRRVCMHLMIQPGVARIFLTDQLLADQGVLSRVLVAAPASLSGTRFYKEPSPESDQKLTLYNQLIHDLLAAPMPLKADTKNELSPRIITLSQEAKAKWINYANFVEAELLPGKKYELIKGLANKLGEHAARLATVLVIAQDPLAAEVNSININMEKEAT